MSDPPLGQFAEKLIAELAARRPMRVIVDLRFNTGGDLGLAARERGISRSEFIRQHLALVLEQYRRHPKPRSAGIVRVLAEGGDERELFGGRR